MAVDAATAQQLSEPARTFLAREHGLLVDGEWRPAADGRTFPTYDPAPFGGRKQSGLGRERGLEGLGAYLETKSVYVAL